MMNYLIKRSKRKTLAIQILPSQSVLIRAPLRCRDEEIQRFYIKHNAWIQNKLSEYQQYPGLPESQYTHNGSLWLLGKPMDIQVITGIRNQVLINSNRLIVTQKSNLNEHKVEPQINRWKRHYGKALYGERLNFWAERFPISLPKFQYKTRKMKRQWGNCNNLGMITINSQLIRYPMHCIDYVIVHELTHLKYLHHGVSFYRLMESVMPDWRENKQLLSQYSGPT